MIENLIKLQKGAMFSMDARIALIIASVLAGVVGTQVIQKVERNRVEAAEISVSALVDGLETYYKSQPTVTALNGLPAGHTALVPLPTNFNTGLGSYQTRVIDAGLVSAALVEEPWGQTWAFDKCVATQTIEGVQVTVHYAVIYSGGPDRTLSSGTGDILANATCVANFAAWNTINDDIGMKFSTIDIERAYITEMKNKLIIIQESLQAYEATKVMENQDFCSTTLNPETLNPRCDFNNDGAYQTGEEIGSNYFPRSATDTVDTAVPPNNYYYIPYGRAAAGTEVGDVAFNLAGMQAFVISLGLDASYATDPWGKLLCYESNRTGNMQSPFTIKLSYAAVCPTP